MFHVGTFPDNRETRQVDGKIWARGRVDLVGRVVCQASLHPLWQSLVQFADLQKRLRRQQSQSLDLVGERAAVGADVDVDHARFPLAA